MNTVTIPKVAQEMFSQHQPCLIEQIQLMQVYDSMWTHKILRVLHSGYVATRFNSLPTRESRYM